MRLDRGFVLLPYPVKVAAASLEGWRLRRWRYGPELEGLVTEVEEREGWSEGQWSVWRERRLAEVLDRAATTVPLYRSRGDVRGTPLEWWPILTKDELRRAPVGSTAPAGIGATYEEHTSGATGTPLRLLFTRRTMRAYYAVYEQRVRRWNDVDGRSRWAILGGRVVADVGRTSPPYWVWNQAFRQLYLSVYHLGGATVRAYAEALERHRVEYLVGYPSALAELARLAIEAGCQLPPVRVTIANAEPTSERQRALVEAAFGAPLRTTYGMSEMTLGASECEAGAMHLWPEVGLLEILDDDGRQVAPGQAGRVVATSLLNVDTPLVRYEVGDSMVASHRQGRCACGRTLPTIGEVEGRLDDLVLCPDGRLVGRLDPVFKADLPIVEAQIEQVGPAAIVVRVVPAPGYDDRSAASVRDRLHDRLGPMGVDVRTVARIERGPGGKFRAVIGWRPDAADRAVDPG